MRPEETQVIFLHGLESDPNSDKAQWLKKNYNAYCPAMDYKNPHMFQDIYNEVLRRNPRIIIGSSMGGWFAYCLSTLTGIRTLLFNPAVQGRSMDPSVVLGRTPAHHTVVLGKSDDVIDPIKSKDWIRKNGIGTFDIKMESIGHRSPLPVLQKYINGAINESDTLAPIPSFEIWNFLNEMNETVIPSGKWVDYDLNKLDQEGIDNVWKMYTDTYGKAGMDFSADDSSELKTKYKATFLIDVDKDHRPDAFIIYKETHYGNKIALLGTNDLKDAKRQLIQKLIGLLNSRGWFIEASLKMEEILASSNVPVIKDEKMMIDIVGKDKKPEMGNNGYYTRLLSKASKRIEKRMYGIPK